LRPERQRAGGAIAGVRRAEHKGVAELFELNIVFNREREFADDLLSGEGPADLAGADPRDDFLLVGDQLGLFVTPVEGIARTETGDAFFPVERRNKRLFVKR